MSIQIFWSFFNRIVRFLLLSCMSSLYILDITAAAAAKSLQSCPTLCDPTEGSLPGSAVPGILQARTLEWVATSFSNAWKWKVKVKSLSHVRLLATAWTAAYQAPPSMGFARQEYWSGLPFPSSHSDWMRFGHMTRLTKSQNYSMKFYVLEWKWRQTMEL